MVLPHSGEPGGSGRGPAHDSDAWRQSMKPGQIDLGRSVLDHQIYDRDHLECGKVDDLEITLQDGVLRVSAILTGPGESLERLPGFLRGLAGFVLGRSSFRIPWE